MPSSTALMGMYIQCFACIATLHINLGFITIIQYDSAVKVWAWHMKNITASPDDNEELLVR